MAELTTSWTASPKQLTLSRDQVHVWRAFFSRELEYINEYRSIITLEEVLRAESYYHQRDRDRCIVSRGVLRCILSRYLSIASHCIRLCRNDYGKLGLDPSAGLMNLQFNLSHAHDVLLVAIAADSRVGIDVEYIHTRIDHEAIADVFFSTSEMADFRELPRELRTQGFYNCWTRKEAVIKAEGRGISFPLHDFAVSLVPGEPATILRASGGAQEIENWSLVELRPACAYIGALAMEVDGLSLCNWEWQVKR